LFAPAVLVTELSTPQRDARPNLRHNGRSCSSTRTALVRTAARTWASTRATTLDSWSTSVNLDGTVNSTFDDQHPAIFPDGETLVFASNRPKLRGGQ
jgi:hypothetical protein